MLQQVLVQGVSDLQSVDKYEYRDILTAVRHLGKLAMEVADVGLEVVTLPRLDREEVMVVFLDFSAGGILGEKFLSHFL